MRHALVFALIVLLASPSRLGAAEPPPFDKAAKGPIDLRQAGPARDYCPLCGMRLASYWKTSHAAELHDGETRQYCSLHCLAIDLERLGDGVARVLVADAATERLVAADVAHYLVDSAVPGTMSAVSTLAFAAASDAEAARARLGGHVETYPAALAATKAARARDEEMLAARRRTKALPAGRKMWETVCRRAFDPAPHATLPLLKAALVASGDCAKLGDPEHQAVALYLFSGRTAAESAPPLAAPPDAKCPVCGMFVAKYPHWVAQAELADGRTLHFDGVKDLLKLVFAPTTYGVPVGAVKTLRVTDYYTLGALDAHEAHYVVGSDVRGPMGHELVPFRTAADAEGFRVDHGGERVLRFDAVTPELLEALDARR